MDLLVRKARLEEAEALAGILTQAMEFKLSRQDKAWGSHRYTTEELRERISKGNTYAVWADKTLVATLLLLWEDEMMWGKQPPDAVYVHQLAIAEGQHGKDIGGELLDWAGEQAVKQGRRFLRLDCPPSNKGLRKYYEKQGFTWVQDRQIHAPQATYMAALYERPTT